MALQVKDVCLKMLDWMDGTKLSLLSNGVKTWCLLGFKEELTLKNLRTFFDRSELNTKYVEAKKTALTQTSNFAAIQAQITFLFGVHKSFASRYQTRLQCYKSELVNDYARKPASVTLAQGRLEKFSETPKVT
ncbi:MAG: hypothetical protein WCG06_03610 [Candidatus Omnitrophota bacterium]